jgi:anti-sigma B factor antagonist
MAGFQVTPVEFHGCSPDFGIAASPTTARGHGKVHGNMQLRTEVSEIAGWTVVSLYGELDVATTPGLREQIVELIADGARMLVLDLDGVDFIDSTGLGTIISILKRARTQGGDLRLVCTQSRITRLFEITGLDKAVPLLPSLDLAVAEG